MSTTKTGFTKIPDELMDSVAWRTAPLGVRCVVLAIWRRHDGRNNGKIRYGRRHAQADLGCGATQACRYLAEAQKRGFIVGIKRGSFDRKSGAHAARATTWRVTMERWKGGDPTNDWANWTRPENFNNGSRSETTTGPGARPNGANGSRSETRLGRQTGPGARPLIKTKSSYHDEVVASAHDGEFAPLAVGAGPQARARPLCPSELGRSDLQAAWLRSWLASGSLTPDEVAAELGLRRQDVDLVASGVRLLGRSDWRQLAALVAGRLDRCKAGRLVERCPRLRAADVFLARPTQA